MLIYTVKSEFLIEKYPYNMVHTQDIIGGLNVRVMQWMITLDESVALARVHL